MSSSLCWEPVIEKKHKTLSTAMKFFLREAYDCDGGSLDVTLGAGDKLFLRGAAIATKDAEIKKDIATVIEQIEKHGEVHIWEQY